MSFLEDLKKDVQKFENVVVKGEQDLRKFSVMVFGEQTTETMEKDAEAAAGTALGKITRSAVLWFENELGSGTGSAKASGVLAAVQIIAGALGVPYTDLAINSLIEKFAPWITSKLIEAVEVKT